MLPRNDMTANQPSPQAEPLSGRLLRHVKAQPGRSALTALLVCVLGVLVVHAASGPKAASADVSRLLLPPAGATQSLVPNLSPDMLLHMAIPVLAPANAPTACSPLPRDIFAIDLRRVPKLGSKSPEELVEFPQTDPSRTQELRQAELKRQVAALRLEGTVTGPASAAFINGTCLAQGASYRGFKVVQVTEQSVQLEREGIQLELRMPD